MSELPGLDRVRNRFLEMLVPRQEQIAAHAVAAWDGETVEEITGNLASAQAILHQIAGTAGSLGFVDLGARPFLFLALGTLSDHTAGHCRKMNLEEPKEFLCFFYIYFILSFGFHFFSFVLSCTHVYRPPSTAPQPELTK